MSSKMTSDEIAKLFADRLPRGGWLSIKQANWLFGVYKEEVREAMRTNSALRRRVGYSATGVITNSEGNMVRWNLYQAPNGAGNFTIEILETEAERSAKLTQQITEMRSGLEMLKAAGAPEVAWKFIEDQLVTLEARQKAQSK